MRRLTRIGLITLALALGVVAVVVTTAGLSAAAVTAEPNLVVEVRAPEHVSLDAPYVVNIGYANQGGANATDNHVSAILPAGVAFVNATNPRGDPWPPDHVDGNTLTWDDALIIPDGTWDHIYVVLQPQASLQEGDLLTIDATISTSDPESDLTNNTASVTSVVCEMAGSSKQAHARTVLPGDVLTYTIRINLDQQAGGGQNGRWVTMTDTMPLSHQVRFLGWQGSVTGTQLDAHTLQWQGRVQAGEPLSLQYRLGVEGDVPPGTILTNVAQMGWAGQHMQLAPVTTPVTLPHGMLGLGPNQGGQVQHRYGVTLDVPPGAVSDTTRFQIQPPLTDTPPITPPGGLLFAHRAFKLNAYRFGDPVGQFNRPVSITVHYTDADVQGLNRETLRLWTREGPEGPWNMLGEPVRVMSGALAFATDHFSEFALFGEALLGEPDLVVEARAPEHVSLDAPYVVNIGYSNQGGANATGNHVSAILPAGVTFVNATDPRGDPWPPDHVSGNTLTWDDALIIPDGTWDHIYVILQPEASLQEGDLLTIDAAISTSDPESDLDNNTASVTSVVCEMAGSSKQVHARTVLPGDVLEYTVNIDLADQPGGGQRDQWVTLIDNLPPGDQVRFLGWVGENVGTLDGDTLEWQGQVQTGEPVQIRYRLGVEGDVPPGTGLTNRAGLEWSGRGLDLDPVAVTVFLEDDMLALGSGQAGQLQHAYGFTLDVPAGAVPDTTRFEFQPLDFDPATIIPPGGLLYANRAFELKAYRFGEPVVAFDAPLALALQYGDADVEGLNRETLRLWTRSGSQDAWTPLGEPDQVLPDALVYHVDHLSQFALFGEALLAEPDLVVEAKAPEHVSLDAPYVVNIGYSNQGGANATDNHVSAILPAGVTFVNATDPRGDPWPPDHVDGNTLTWDDALIIPDGTWDHIYVVLQPQASLQEGDLLTVTATISTSDPESNLDNNTASVSSIVSQMAGSSKQAHARTILPGDVLTYTIRIDLDQQAGGGQSWRDVTLTDTIPFSHQVRFLGWRGSVTGTQLDAHTLQWQERVQAGEPLTLQYRLGVEGDVPPGTILTNVAQLGWAGQHMQLAPVTTPVTLPHGMLGLGPNQGGQVQHRYGVTLDVPPAAVSDTIRFQIGPLLDGTPPITPPGGLLFAHRAFEMTAFRFGEQVRQFSRSLTITVNYSDTDVQGLRRETLRLWTREGPEGPWNMLGEPVRVMSGALAFTTNHLSQFALFGEGEFKVYMPLVIR